MSRSLIRKNQLHPDMVDLVGQYGSGFFASNGQTVYTSGNQRISGNKNFIDKIEIGNSPDNAIYVDNDGTLIISGRDLTPQGMKLILSNDENETSITFDPDYHGLIFQGDSYLFNDGLLQIEGDGVSELRLGGIGTDGTKKISFYDDGVLNFQIINDVANDYENVHFSGKKANFSEEIVAPKGLDLQNSPIINSVPQLVTQTGNFSISGNSNGRMIISNTSTLITGTITSGNATGFNASIIQVGTAQIQITGDGAGVKINSYNNQYRTAGQFATISLLHTGNNGYIMYGNTST